MKLVVSAADYGMTDGITDGCLKAIRDGILVDVGLMTNNPSCVRAAKEIKNYPHVCVGQDFNLVSGIPVTDAHLIPSLTNHTGRFYKSVERKSLGLPDVTYEDAYLECENQLKRFIDLMGYKPAYILGHSWSCENTVKAGYDVAKKYNVPANLDKSDKGFEQQCQVIRTVKSWYTVPQGVKEYSKEAFNSADHQRFIDVVNFIIHDEARFLNNEYSLFRNHCGYPDAELFELSTYHVVRVKDLEALCSDQVKQWIHENHIEVINFAQLLKERPYHFNY